ncbi:MAG TPA: HupE/UreJ family protein [Arenibaculum sp.]|nr:HupE/UreJ family protein [Arenibaculum sp.]
MILSRLLRSSVVLALVIVTGALSMPARAHDMPTELPVRGYFRSDEGRAELLIRIPLAMLANVNLPKRGSAYLDLDGIGDGLRMAAEATSQGFVILADGNRVEPAVAATRIRLPSDRAFSGFDRAMASLHGPPLPASETVVWNQGFFDAHFTYAVPAGTRDCDIDLRLPPGMDAQVTMSLDVIQRDGMARTLSFGGDAGRMPLDPSWSRTGFVFLKMGVEHILAGVDHLLFLLCLILPLRRDLRRLAIVVTAFTIGHSTTLIPAALGMVPAAGWFSPFVETMIAVSILYTAAENVLGSRTAQRWQIAYGFGLIHGFGFAATLTDVQQLAGSHLVWSLVTFNIGVELGQALVLLLLVPALLVALGTRRADRIGTILLSLVVGHQALHWIMERASAIRISEVASTEPAVLLTLFMWVSLGVAGLLGAWLVKLSLLPANRRPDAVQ